MLPEAAPAPVLPPGKPVFLALSAHRSFVPGVGEKGFSQRCLIKALSPGSCFVSGRVAKLKRETAFGGRIANSWKISGARHLPLVWGSGRWHGTGSEHGAGIPGGNKPQSIPP